MFYITTERLRLIPLTHELLKQCHENRALMEVDLGLDISDMQIDDDYKAELKNAMECFWLPKTLEHPDRYQWYTNWEIVLISNNTAIGGIGFVGYPTEEGTAEVGYMIDERERSKGYAGEALEGLIEWGRSNARIHQVIARTHQDNLPSQKLLLKAGFVKSEMEEEIVIYTKKYTMPD